MALFHQDGNSEDWMQLQIELPLKLILISPTRYAEWWEEYGIRAGRKMACERVRSRQGMTGTYCDIDENRVEIT